MSADVVIVGAGVVGCATAYYLARAGAQVTIVERDSVGSHASGFALGGLNPLSGVGIPDPLGPLALEGFHLHLALATALREETGIDVELRMHSALTLALTEAEAVAMKHRLPWQQAQEDFSVAWWSAKEILKMEPRLTPRVVGGVVIRQVGLLDSSTYCLALLEAATRRGATVRTGQVRGLRYQGSRVAAVQLAHEELTCQAVVIAMGPWTGDSAAWMDVELPVIPLKGQILRLRAGGPPFPYISWSHSYVVSKPDGLVWVGTTEEDAGFDETPSPKARQGIMENVLGMLPCLEETELVLHTACLRPVTADGLPILGQVPQKQGVVVATGGGRKGILLSPIMGRVAAELVTTGTTEYDISALTPGRPVSTAQVAASQRDPFRF